MLKDALVTQVALTGLLLSFLYYLRVQSLSIYVSLYAIIYITTMMLAEPMPRRVRSLHIVLLTVLVAIFAYFAVLRIMAILGGP